MSGGRVRRFLESSAQDRRTLLASACLLPAIRSALAAMGYARTSDGLARMFRVREAVGQWAIEDARHLRRLVDAAARHGGSRATCLPQALTTWVLLRRRGIASAVCLGARRDRGELRAHAWVEVDGRSLDEPGDSGGPYEVLLRRSDATVASPSRSRL